LAPKWKPGENFAEGENWPTLDEAIINARETVRRDGKQAWIQCDKKFVLSPDYIVAAYPDVKATG